MKEGRAIRPHCKYDPQVEGVQSKKVLVKHRAVLEANSDLPLLPSVIDLEQPVGNTA